MSQKRETKDREGVVSGLRKREEGDDLKMVGILSRGFSPGD
jgi:predicted FMN-binding regulatory protein PaiB